MKSKILRHVSFIILTVFTVSAFLQPSFAYADVKTGSIKIFSEVKGIQLFIDEKPFGTDTVEINDVPAGQHYVKATYNNAIIYSELITVNPGQVSAVLIKATGEAKQNIMNSMYKEQQEYKNKKLDIIVNQNTQTTGTTVTTFNRYPGFFSLMDTDVANSTSTTSTITDWKIIQGGVQEISDTEFASLVNDTDTQKRMSQDWDNYNSTTNWGGFIGLTGLIMVLVGGYMAFSSKSSSDTANSGAVICAVGVIPTVVGLGMLSKNPPSGHYVTPAQAAKQAHDYNQNIKKTLGLPEDFEPQQ